jgi:WD40 repeat protein
MGDRDHGATSSTGPVLALAISPDGTYLASAGGDGAVRIWEVATGRVRAVLGGHAGPVRELAISPDGTYLASAGEDGVVRIWEVATGRASASLRGHAGPVLALAISPDGTYLASAGEDGEIRIWGAREGDSLHVFIGHAGPVRELAISPDGTYLASAGGDGTVRIWEIATGRANASLRGHAGPVLALRISPDGTYLASAAWDGTVRIWDAATGRERARLDAGSPVRELAISPDGTYVASAGGDGTVRIWEVATGRVRAVLGGHAGPVRELAISPDGTYLASAAWDGTVRIWDATTGREHVHINAESPILALAISPDGTYLASAGGDGAVRIWEPFSGTQISLYRAEATAFISYAREDQAIADRLRQLLTSTGLAAWSDEQISPGSSIAGEIERAIRAADVIFFISSAKSNESPAVSAELAMAISERNRNPRKVIVPVLANGAESIPPLLRDMVGLNISSDQDAINKLSLLGRQITTGENLPLRTQQDRAAQLDLLRAELDTVEDEASSHKENLRFRELNLSILAASGIGLAIFASISILSLFLVIGNHNVSAWLVAAFNGTTVAFVITLFKDWWRSGRSPLASRSRNDDS